MVIRKMNTVLVKHNKILFGIITVVIIISFVWFFIPGLDGSRFLFLVLEAIRRKPIKPEREAMVNIIGMVFLLSLMAFFTFRDVWRLFQ